MPEPRVLKWNETNLQRQKELQTLHPESVLAQSCSLSLVSQARLSREEERVWSRSSCMAVISATLSIAVQALNMCEKVTSTVYITSTCNY